MPVTAAITVVTKEKNVSSTVWIYGHAMVNAWLSNVHAMAAPWNAKTSTSRTVVASAVNTVCNAVKTDIIIGDAKYSMMAPPALVIAVKKISPKVVAASVSGCKKN